MIAQVVGLVGWPRLVGLSFFVTQPIMGCCWWQYLAVRLASYVRACVSSLCLCSCIPLCLCACLCMFVLLLCMSLYVCLYVHACMCRQVPAARLGQVQAYCGNAGRGGARGQSSLHLDPWRARACHTGASSHTPPCHLSAFLSPQKLNARLLALGVALTLLSTRHTLPLTAMGACVCSHDSNVNRGFEILDKS